MRARKRLRRLLCRTIGHRGVWHYAAGLRALLGGSERVYEPADWLLCSRCGKVLRSRPVTGKPPAGVVLAERPGAERVGGWLRIGRRRSRRVASPAVPVRPGLDALAIMRIAHELRRLHRGHELMGGARVVSGGAEVPH